MQHAYSLEDRKRVLASIDEGLSRREVAKRLGISESSIQRFVKMRRTSGLTGPLPVGGGPKRLLDPQAIAALERLRLENPQATLAALAAGLAERCGVRVGIATIQRALANQGITYVRRPHAAFDTQPERQPPKLYAFARDVAPPDRPERRAYPSDLTDVQWSLIEPLIPKSKPGGRPEEWPRRELVNAMLYVLHNGCTWRALPHDLPPWSTVYSYFRKWRIGGLWRDINDQLRSRSRLHAGRAVLPTAAIMDSQSAHTTEKGGPADGMAINA